MGKSDEFTHSDSFHEIAHVKMDENGEWLAPHSLYDHLFSTGNLTACFADKFQSGPWGRTIGIGHDIAKSPLSWQAYLRQKSGYEETEETILSKLDHSSPSAKLAEEILPVGIGRLAAYTIAGHHTGLPDFFGTASSLQYRLENADTSMIPDAYKKLLEAVSREIPAFPWKFTTDSLDLSLWVRMLFSCLVDADSLDTEAYMTPDRAEIRGDYLPLDVLSARFDAFIGKLQDGKPHSHVNELRKTVLSDCRAAAAQQPGFFSLTVPTGGGKTYSSLAFGLTHGVHHHKDRIIYVIPYTSIIEQNADAIREAVGAEQVIEHHSNFDSDAYAAKHGGMPFDSQKMNLAAENWDAPIIVTTTVQFFESLLSAGRRSCRKLHNIVNSVVILDEAQLLPVHFLAPILETMKLLVEHYGVTFVISTATQPVLECSRAFPSFPGLPEGSVREIIQDVPSLYKGLERVQVHLEIDEKKTWEEISEELQGYPRVLCVVSDRLSCRYLHSLMPSGTYHLSALMCPEHRSLVIKEIKRRLKERPDDIIRVISTQLVEAGVDLDFPVVYRAVAGFDSIAQAAGRCNREGALPPGQKGRVVVFTPPKLPPPGMLRKAMDTTVNMVNNGLPDEPLSPSVFHEFFSLLFWKANSYDKEDICTLLKPRRDTLGMSFRTASKVFRMVEDGQMKTILVPFREGRHLIEELKRKGPERWLLRKLQRYSVNVYENQFNILRQRGSLAEIAEGVFSLTCEVEYSNATGLLVDDFQRTADVTIVMSV